MHDELHALSQRFADLVHPGDRGPTLLPASPAEVEQLQALSGRQFSSTLQAFYLEVGGLGYYMNQGGFHITIEPPTELIAALNQTQSYKKLNGLGLLDVISYSWDNGKRSLTLEEMGEDYFLAMRAPTCIGWIGDGGFEEYAYIIEREGEFGAYIWHQDHAFHDPDEVVMMPLQTLLLHALNTYLENDNYFSCWSFQDHIAKLKAE